MICPTCGQQNADSSMFCANCGSSLAEAPTRQAATQPAAQPAVQQPAAQPAAQQAAPQQPYQQPAPAQQQAYGQQPYAGTPAAPAPSVEGCISAAWKDITGTPGWAKRVLILCLIGCIPILNFAVIGYCLRWSRELAFGKREGMPTMMFRKKEISTGFFSVLVSFAIGSAFGLVATIAFLLISGLFGIIHPAAGFVVAVILLIVFTLFFVIALLPVVDACIMRMAVVGYLESGFNMKLVFQSVKKGFGSLLAASLVPRIIVGLITGLIVAIIMAIFIGIAAAIGAAATSDPSRMARMASQNPVMLMSMFSGAVYIGMLGYLLMIVIELMGTVVSELLAYRAVGHWIARYAPEWANESDEGLQSDADQPGVAV